MAISSRIAQHGKRAALALADFRECLQALRRDRQHVAFLGFVAPDLPRRHATVLGGHRAQLEARAAAGGVDEFGHRIGQPARTHVVDRENRIVVAQLPAAVDHFLRPALDFRVAALHRIEIQVFRIRAGAHRGRRPAAHADQHSRPAELNQQCLVVEDYLRAMRGRDIANAAGEHDRLVVTASRSANQLLECPEVTREARPAEFVVECGGADRPVQHDLQRGHDPAGTPVVLLLPWPRHAGNTQVGNRVAHQACFRLRSPSGRAFVHLAARARRSARERRDRGGMIVGFAFDDQICFLRSCPVDKILVRIEALRHRTFKNRCIVGVGQHGALRVGRMAVPDHREQRLVLLLAVDDPVRIEDLVAAVLGIGLREHAQLRVARIAAERAVRGAQVVDFIVAQRKAKARVRLG